ncbi:ubiquitin carboxyl-terminal hydrolase 5-like [Salvia splendens]|uniref:ubiquitin carboxyl-terminal hydrolase 5-like n=1 Tax=Salvia splendens TaxID=180675 RepID=UPI001C26AA96|nr:ubiquitin carboxyl-terminal hydrolase 5-like [Salvia splendens]
MARKLTPEEEKQAVRDISVAAEAQTKVGDTFYLITQRWWQDWLEYVNQTSIVNDESSSEHQGAVNLSALKKPSCIDNSDLIDEAVSEDSAMGIELHDTLVEGTDYILLPKEVWNKMHSWYGGGPVLARIAINTGLSQTELSVDVYPLRLELHLMPKGERSAIRISKKETIGELHRKACEIFDLTPKQVSIWDYFSHQKHALMNDMEKTLDDANIQMDQDILVEVINIKLEGGLSSNQENGSMNNGSLAAATSHSSIATSGGLSASKYSSRNGNSGSHFQNLNTEKAYGTSGVSARGAICGLTGLLNLGNTCFMNSAIQCLVHTPEFARYFCEGYHQEINRQNPLGMVGELALAFGDLLRKLWAPGRAPVAPRAFKAKLVRFAPQFSGCSQHDSQRVMVLQLKVEEMMSPQQILPENTRLQEIGEGEMQSPMRNLQIWSIMHCVLLRVLILLILSPIKRP